MATLNPIKALRQLYAFIWTVELKDLSRLGAFLMQMLRVSLLLVRHFQNRQIRLRAMGLVYLTLISAVPVLAFTVSILKSFGFHNRFRDVLLTLVEPLGDQGATVVDQALKFVDSMQIQGLGFAGVIVLVIATLSALQMIETALNNVWHVRKPRNFVERLQTYFLIMTVGPVLGFGSLAFTAGLASSSLVETISQIAIIGPILAEGGRWWTFVLATSGFMFLFWLMPHARVRLAPALWSAVLSAGAWMFIGWIFSLLIVSSGRYDVIYSAFASLVLFMLWTFFSWMVMLVGAHGSYLLQYPEYIVERPMELELSISDQELLALRTLQLIGKRHYGGEPPFTFDELNASLRVPWQALESVLDILQRGRFISETSAEPATFVATAPFEDVTVAEALSYFRRSGRSLRRRTFDGSHSKILQSFFKDSEANLKRETQALTLKSLALEEDKEKPELLVTGTGQS